METISAWAYFLTGLYGLIGVYLAVYAALSTLPWFTPRVLSAMFTAVSETFFGMGHRDRPDEAPLLSGYLAFGVVVLVLLYSIYVMLWPAVALVEIVWLRYRDYRASRSFRKERI